jgi:hypothetical protein
VKHCIPYESPVGGTIFRISSKPFMSEVERWMSYLIYKCRLPIETIWYCMYDKLKKRNLTESVKLNEQISSFTWWKQT